MTSEAIEERIGWSREDAPRLALEALPYGVLVTDPEGRVLHANQAAEGILDLELDEPVTCCDLLGCELAGTVLEGSCITRLALEADEVLPEIRLDVPVGEPERGVWVTAQPMRAPRAAVLHLRPGEMRDRRRRTEPHWIAEPRLRVHALGRTAVERGKTPIGGGWLEQRPGQLLKYLICERGRIVPTDEIGEALWPYSERTTVRGRVRHAVHVLRRQLEPERGRHDESAFVMARQGGYGINADRLDLDVDVFEGRASAGLRHLSEGRIREAKNFLHQAVALSRGDFLADEPFAEWAFAERERLRDLMSQVLRASASLELQEGDLDAAAAYMERLSSLQPFDPDVHRDLITLCLRRGRRSEAVRRYRSLSERLGREFGETPGFTLADLMASLDSPDRG